MRQSQHWNGRTGSPYLALGHKDCHVVSGSGRESKVCHALSSQLVPDSLEIIAVVKLYFVGYETGAVSLIGGVLQIPAVLGLLHKLPQRLLGRSFSKVLDGAPDLEILGGIAVFILGRSFPCRKIGTTRGKADLVDIGQGEGGQNIAGGGISNAHAFIRDPSEVAATWGVYTAP